MVSRRRAPVSYRVAQRQARSVERDLLRRIGARLDQALQRAVQDLIVRFNLLPDSTPFVRLRALEQSIEIFQAQRNRLIQVLEQAIATGRRTSYDDILKLWQEAATAAAKTVGLPNAALGAVLNPRISLLAAYENVGGARLFRTLIRRAAQDGYRAVNEILRAGILEGKSFDQLARELRPWVQGGTGGDLGAAFDTVRFNATRIAYSEIHNARAEAEVQHFAADPLVESVAWRLAPDRGTNRGPDACDALAENDFYGLGAGVYPCNAVPLPPHPFDRCERVPITRAIDKADDPKPSPGLQTNAIEVARGGNMSDAARANMERATRSALVGA
jgi:hypothetical protein